MARKVIEEPNKPSNVCCTSFLPIEKMKSNSYQKLLETEKERCVRLRSGDKRHPRKFADRKAQIRKAFASLTGLICAFRSADFLRCVIPRVQPHAQFLFLFPIVFFVLMDFIGEVLCSVTLHRKYKSCMVGHTYMHARVQTQFALKKKKKKKLYSKNFLRQTSEYL